ncbi:MAG: glycosyltransferase family 2 protein [Pseudonocardiaceae bacterium]
MTAQGPPPATTVVIPVWGDHARERVGDALASVGAQDREVAVVLVDNAAEPPVEPVPGVRLLRSEARLTLGGARNLGLAHAVTEYVIFWDADDRMLPGTVRFLEARMEASRNLVAFGSAIVEEPSGRRHRWPRPWLRILVRLPALLGLLDAVWSEFPTTGATLIRADAVRAAGGFADADSGEDWCLGAALVWRGRCGWSERPGRVYVQRPDSTWPTHASGRHQWRHAAAVRARLREAGVAPSWLRHLLPAIAAAQWGAIAAHVLLAGVRARRHMRGRPAREAPRAGPGPCV